MLVRILFFGILKDLAGHGGESLDLPENATLGDVLSHYEARIPRLKEWISSIAMSVNQEYAGPEAKLRQGDEIALLPPVSGGAGKSEPGAPTGRAKHAAIVRERIETQRVLEGIKRAEDGAAVVFEGVVRDNTRGRRTLYLDYEAYEDMAVKQMEELSEQALSRFPIRDVAILHRLGRLEIGETSVLIVVASGHRAAAFDACRWLIDTLKRTVPIWKKEYFEDGVVWADGEPFPSEIPRPQGTPASKRASK
jgi:molybdopterin synthase catalytic subunit